MAAVPSIPAHGPLALLRRYRRLGADRPPRPAGHAHAPRRRPPALRLRRGDPAPAAAHRRAARHAGHLPHPPPRRPLARAAGDAQVLRAARPPGSADGLRPARHGGAHARHADRLRAPALPLRGRRPRGRRRRRVRRLRGRAVQRPPPRPRLRLRDRRGAAARALRRRAGARAGRRSGPDFGRLQRGEVVNGVRPEQVVGPERAGRKIVLSGDTAPCEMLQVAAHEADVLVHEATFTDEEHERACRPATRPPARRPSSPREAEVRLLVLTHLSTRYAGGEIRDEARATSSAPRSRATSTPSRCRSPRRASPSCSASTPSGRARDRAPRGRAHARAAAPLRARRFGPLAWRWPGPAGSSPACCSSPSCGGAQPVYKERTLTVARPCRAARSRRSSASPSTSRSTA